MAKPIRRYSNSNLRRNRKIDLYIKLYTIGKGIIHVQASFNNTIVTIRDVRGRVVVSASAGACGPEDKDPQFQDGSRGGCCQEQEVTDFETEAASEVKIADPCAGANDFQKAHAGVEVETGEQVFLVYLYIFLFIFHCRYTSPFSLKKEKSRLKLKVEMI